MLSRKRFQTEKHWVRIALAAITMAPSLVLTGCGRQIVRAEEHQLRLQRPSEVNGEQIARILARLEDDQKKLHVAIANLQASTKEAFANIAAVEQKQHGLRGGIERVKSGVQKIANGTDAVLQNMSKLLDELQSNSHNRPDTMNVVGQKQLELEERIPIKVQAIADAVKAIEQQQGKLQGQIGDAQNNTQGLRKEMIAILERLRAELSEIDAQLVQRGR